MKGSPLPRLASASVPTWLWGNNVGTFLREQLGFHAVAEGAGRWRIQTDESYRRAAARLVGVLDLAGPGVALSDFGRLARFDPNEARPSLSNDEVQAAIDRAAVEADAGGVVQLLTLIRLQVQLCAVPQLPAVVEDAYDALRAITAEGSQDPVFRNASVHVITRDAIAASRARFPSVMMRVLHDQDLASGNVGAISRLNAAGEEVFASSSGLGSGLFLMDAYLAPLLGALSPSLWAFSVHRPLGTILFCLGQPIAGSAGDPAEPLQLLPQQGPEVPLPVARISATAGGAAARWWTQRLNALVGNLTDPALFTDASGEYLPAKQFHSVLTLEQLFRRVGAIQAAERDSNARRVLLFTVLDTLERVTGRDIERLSSISFAGKTLEALRAQIPADAAEVLLPQAERAVASLERVRDGFFLPRQTGATELKYLNDSGKVETLSLDDAAKHYVKVLRNATHGHGGRGTDKKKRTDALLSSHDGRVPHDLALLGYLYLLDIVARPDLTARTMYSGGRV